jgi:hypothetical protein
MPAIAVDDAAQTIFPTGITRGTSHNFSFSLYHFYIHTILQVIVSNQLRTRGVKKRVQQAYYHRKEYWFFNQILNESGKNYFMN